MTKPLLEKNEEGITVSFTLPNDYLTAIEDRIVERLLSKLHPLLQSIPTDDELLTIEEASTYLKKSKAQIYQWANNKRHGLGDFPVKKAGKSLRFSKRELNEWMRENATKR